jgi:succinate-semialdehyde dehydrogenase/glutarate-semialdehyde dehydrogenase
MKLLVSNLKLGDPMDTETAIGPLARPEFVEEIETKVNKSVEMGAKIVVGGKRSPIHTGMYLPTLLTDIKENMPVFCEETFGPVAVIIPFTTDEEAIQIANNTQFGLGASIWTTDMKKAKKISQSIEAGCVFINSMVKSDPRLPFGGIKNSGFGRELTTFGVHEFMNLKTEWID